MRKEERSSSTPVISPRSRPLCLIMGCRQSGRLRGLMTGVEDDLSSFRIKLSTMIIYMGWGGSIVSLANKSIMYLVLDELDKIPEFSSKKEASTIDLAEKRVTAYPHDYKIFKLSTPTVESGAIWQALTVEAQVIFEYWGRCPLCGKLQFLKFGGSDEDGNMLPGGIRWPKDATADEIESKKLAWYECEHCAGRWSDYQRDIACRHGEWRAKNDGRELTAYLRREKPQKIGFHRPAWISPLVSLSKIAERFLRGLEDRNVLKDFRNNYAAEPWQEIVGKERRIESVLALKSADAQENVVPDWALVLLLTADIQKEGIWYELRAWGHDQTSQLLRHGFLAKGILREGILSEDFRALSQIGTASYYTAGKIEHRLRFGIVDSGYRTDEVYDFCRAFPVFAPSKGHDTKVSPITYSKIDTIPGTGRLIPGGITLIHVDTTYFKDKLYNRLKVNSSDPGAWILHTSTDDGYAYQYTAEIKDEEIGLWQQRGNQANHLWDCGVLQLVAFQILYQRGEINRLAQQQEQRRQPRQPTARQQPSERPQLW